MEYFPGERAKTVNRATILLILKAEFVGKNFTNLKIHLTSCDSTVTKVLLDEEATLKTTKCRRAQCVSRLQCGVELCKQLILINNYYNIY